MSKLRLLEPCTAHGIEETTGDPVFLSFGRDVIIEISELPAGKFNPENVKVQHPTS